jgi:arsenical pump membrane protein
MQIATWSIAAVATFGVIVRPWGLPEFVWALLGAVLLVVTGLLPFPLAMAAIAKGTDVYLFLIGMMLLAEVARQEGLFEYLAALAVRQARGSAKRLFAIVYAVGTVVTVFLSNDATAVVLTPAVYAATRAARVEPLPYLFICAFIANAASFVLPISNPANLVIFGSHMPPLPLWLWQLGLPSIAAILATFVALRFTQRHNLLQSVANDVPIHPLPLGGKLVASGIALTAIVLLAASTLGIQLGLPTFLAGITVTVAVLMIARESPLPILKGVAWGVLPLVAGLFVLVDGVAYTGVLRELGVALQRSAQSMPLVTEAASGAIVAIGSNLINNLPMGLIAATTSQAAQASPQLSAALTIGVDLGPNLSVTGSLATILWLIALRREGIQVGAGTFLKVGSIVMTPALILSLLVLLVLPR